MIGQHVYMRYLDESGNGGTWTAAVTEQITDKETLTQVIEPKCIVEEPFGNFMISGCPDNNVLRLYSRNGATVVSRTYWVRDTVTEAEGRRCGFCHGHILTGRDAFLFLTDFSGFLDPRNFESYGNLADRFRKGLRGTGLIDPKLSLKPEPDWKPDRSVFSTCGIGKEEFILLMSGLYKAMSEGKTLAVLLPAQQQKAWEEQGSTLTEQLACQIMGLLPDFTRLRFSFCSHWDCDLSTPATGGLSLVFVHAGTVQQRERLKKTCSLILDLDAAKQGRTAAPGSETGYLSFLWETLEQENKRAEFWNYAKQNYRCLLQPNPAALPVMESIYLVRQAGESEGTGGPVMEKVFLQAAETLWAAGGEVPALDGFITNALQQLGTGRDPLPERFEHAFIRLLNKKKEAAYDRILINALAASIRDGRARTETAEQFVNLASGDKRISACVKEIAENFLKTGAAQLSVQSFYVVCILTEALEAGRIPECDGIRQEIREFFFHAAAENPFVNECAPAVLKAVRACLMHKNCAAEDLERVYGILSGYLEHTDRDITAAAVQQLSEEEKRIYYGAEGSGDAQTRYRLFLDMIDSLLMGTGSRIDPVYFELIKKKLRMLFYAGEENLEKFLDFHRYLCSIQTERTEDIEKQVIQETRRTPSVWQPEKLAGLFGRCAGVFFFREVRAQYYQMFADAAGLSEEQLAVAVFKELCLNREWSEDPENRREFAERYRQWLRNRIPYSENESIQQIFASALDVFREQVRTAESLLASVPDMKEAVFLELSAAYGRILGDYREEFAGLPCGMAGEILKTGQQLSFRREDLPEELLLMGEMDSLFAKQDAAGLEQLMRELNGGRMSGFAESHYAVLKQGAGTA